MVSTLMERWLKNCRGDGLFLSQCPSIRQKPDNLTYFLWQDRDTGDLSEVCVEAIPGLEDIQTHPFK